ncbi:hypothetical protein NE237_025245 [Protea cynaroides]|uniref:Mitochondrial ATP synthase subunit G protein n=1 Tax=Protea cynaroides TaxID=273540 RepID=A0A9Q0H6Q0_9MAGN|nr:hypothetical protein NE237_025245 [Protea cynaroides]
MELILREELVERERQLRPVRQVCSLNDNIAPPEKCNSEDKSCEVSHRCRSLRAQSFNYGCVGRSESHFSDLPSLHLSANLPFLRLQKEERERFNLEKFMASKLQQIQAKAVQASKFVAKHGCAYQKQLLEQNKKYVQEPPTVEKCNELSKQLFYTRLASIPGRTESFWKEVDYVKQLWKNRQELKVEDVGIGALFGLECYAWYCAGEIIGRGFTFTGYYV